VSGPVDVLAVLGKMRRNSYCWDGYQVGDAYAADQAAVADEAITAVAELLEAIQALAGSVDALINDGLMPSRALERVILQPAIAAIAKATGEQP